MGDAIVKFDFEADPGLKFPSPAVRDEIGELAPIFVEDGSVTEVKMANSAVSTRTIRPGAVGSAQIAEAGIATVNLADECVTSDKLELGAVTSEKAGVGVVIAVNSAGDPIMLTHQVLTAVEYAAIDSPDPNTVYFITP